MRWYPKMGWFQNLCWMMFGEPHLAAGCRRCNLCGNAVFRRCVSCSPHKD